MRPISEATRAAIIAARSQSAVTMRQWREGSEVRAATAAFADCGASPERAADRAEALLADKGWAEALLAPLVGALAADPFFEPSLKFHRDSRRVGAVLFDCPAASIAASVGNAAAMAAQPPRSIIFTGRIAVTRVVEAGGATLRRWTAVPVSPEHGTARCVAAESRLLRDGTLHRTDGRIEAQSICDATRDVVTLVATIRAGAAPLMREFDLETGMQLRVADGDDRPSRTAMLLQFLRVAGKAEASAAFEAATRAPDFHLRWAAMREWLALDAARAAPRLAEMARADPCDKIRVAAAHMHGLVEARLAEARCPG
ncbi:hypothetical protein Q9Q95_16620 [Sphingomonas sp. DG1-23]|uniref:hypothetical protein n=1 Tax=Sphingomonas sp. DG1-23 TaxID=3068316 RepID=UPI00273E0D9C|nr:hypothetical protein [Sphingomonas sp. DG1-23]MDP5280555.1 hypothetical protein [Sphingomonas sp. DG1-23]